MVKKFKFTEEELHALKNLLALGKEQENLVLKHSITSQALQTVYQQTYAQIFKRLGIDVNKPGFKMNINFDLNKNEIVVEETPEIVKANPQTMNGIAKTQKALDSLKGDKRLMN